MAKKYFWDSGLSTGTNIACSWPILLVALGGLLGALFGVIAWKFNVKIMKSDFIGFVTYPAIILTGLIAFAAHFFCMVFLAILFPEVFIR